MPIAPLYQYLDPKSSAPAVSAAAVTPNDGSNLAVTPCRALYVGTTGNLNVDMADGSTVLFTAVPIGVFPIQVARVRATSTTALNIVALY
jgi:hypothetical protein